MSAGHDAAPPHDVEAEAALLGSILLKPDVIDDLADLLDPSHFWVEGHATLCSTMCEIHQAGRRIDVTLLLDELRRTNRLEAAGGQTKLVQIAQCVPNAAHARYYAGIVGRKAIFREIQAAGRAIAEIADDVDPLEALADAESTILRIGQRHAMADYLHDAQGLMRETLDHVERRMLGSVESCVSSGFTDLDKKLGGGLRAGEMIVVAGRPSMGKTAFATNVAQYVAVRQSLPVLFISLEMSAADLGDRILASESNVSLEAIRQGVLSDHDRAAIQEGAAAIANSRLFVDDAPTRSLHQIAALARRLHRKHSLGLLAIDYIGLVRASNPRDPRQEQVALLSRGIKALARELKIPVIALSQLNRATEDTVAARPRLSNLRESGAIEQDADVVIFVHRDEYYLSGQERDQAAGQATAIVAKQRNGPTGDCQMVWRREVLRFEDKAPPRLEEFESYSNF